MRRKKRKYKKEEAKVSISTYLIFSMPTSASEVISVSKSATTGQMLQGSGLDKLLVSEWHNKAIWMYVALSRARTCTGIFLRGEQKPNIAHENVKTVLTEELMKYITRYTSGR